MWEKPIIMHGKQSMKRTLSAGNLYREEDANSAIDDPIAGTSSTTAGTSTSTGYTVVNSKRRCKRKQPSNQALSQQPPVINDRLHMYDEVINSVANQSESNTDKNFVHPSAGDSQLPFCDVSDRINDIQRLKETVIVLQNQLNFVLSFLGITEVNNLADDHHNVLSLRANNTIVNKQPYPMNDRVHPQLPESVGTDAIIVEADHNQTRPSESYAKVVCKPATLSAPFRDAVVSAVYNEFEEKDRRARNIVVSGVPSSSSDKTFVENLCRNELSTIVEVIKCRRLGQSQPGRLQPVHATLRSPSDAEAVIKLAKNLRQSSDTIVRNSIYINPDMTKAESLAAYQRRCRRRELAARRATNTTHSVGGSVTTQPGTSFAVSQSSTDRYFSTTSVNVAQHSIPVLNTRRLPSQRSSFSADCQATQLIVNTVQDVADADADADVVPLLPEAIPALTAETAGPQPVANNVLMDVAVPSSNRPVNVHYPTTD